MALSYLDEGTIGRYLSEMWKRELGTGQDPANGRWYKNRPNGEVGGLYGDLTDRLSSELVFDESSIRYVNKPKICDTSIVDNRNGLTPHATAILSYNRTKSTTTSHSQTESMTVGIGMEIALKSEFADIKLNMKFEYSHSWGSSEAVSESESHTFSTSVDINVPPGKVYKAVLESQSPRIEIPYRAFIYVSGMTETWFERQVKSHYQWEMPIGFAFSRIAEWGLAGKDSYAYGIDQKTGYEGTVVQFGTITHAENTDAVTKIWDITDSYSDDIAMSSPRITDSESTPIPGKLVQEIQL